MNPRNLQAEVEQLQKNSTKKSRTVLIVVGIICAFLVLIAILGRQDPEDFPVFTGDNQSDSYLDVTYLMGPFATSEDETENFYIASDKDDYWYVVGIGGKTDIPVFGEDIFDDTNTSTLETHRLVGSPMRLNGEIREYLVELLNYSGVDTVTVDNINSFIGEYYLDTIDYNANDMSYFLIVVAVAAFVITLLIVVLTNNKVKKVNQNFIQSQEYQMLEYDYNQSMTNQPSVFANTSLVVTPHYIAKLDKKANQVVPLENLKNIYRSRIVNGEIVEQAYLILEYEDGYVPINTLQPISNKVIAELDQIVARVRAEHAL